MVADRPDLAVVRLEPMSGGPAHGRESWATGAVWSGDIWAGGIATGAPVIIGALS